MLESLDSRGRQPGYDRLSRHVDEPDLPSDASSLMHRVTRFVSAVSATVLVVTVAVRAVQHRSPRSSVTVTHAIAHDVSGPLNGLTAVDGSGAPPTDSGASDRARRTMTVEPNELESTTTTTFHHPAITVPPGSADSGSGPRTSLWWRTASDR